MRSILAAFACILSAGTALADQALPGKLAGQAIVPAESFFNPPADAPADLAVSGKFTNTDKKRIDTVGSVMGASYISATGVPRETGVKLPFKGQPMQGFSGLKSNGDGTFWVLQDNGFGTKANSPDAMLVLHRIRPDWAGGKVEVLRTIFVHDPRRSRSRSRSRARRSAISPVPISTWKASRPSVEKSGSATNSAPTSYTSTWTARSRPCSRR